MTSEKELSIEADFTDFGSDLSGLRRRLRAAGSSIDTTFPDYARRFRRLLGVRSEQAMELFHQTVSMKSVGNLNEFVRSHMLEPVDASEKVTAIVAHFDDLTKAHEAVRRAKDQLAALAPLVVTADKYDAALERRDALEQQRDAVRLYFAELRVRLFDEQIRTNEESRDALQREVDAAARTSAELARARDVLIAERAAAGGDRVGELERLAQEAGHDLEVRSARRERFDAQLAAAGLEPIAEATSFGALASRVGTEVEQLRATRRALDDQVAGLGARRQELARLGEETRAELTSLAARRNNLPLSHLDLREQLCADLGLEIEALPFAGELVDLAEGYDEWRGAAERVLRGFALSLLVPQEHYTAVARWVNERRLTYLRDDGRRRGMRLVYQRVPRRAVALQPSPGHDALMLADVLETAPGEFQGYLRDQIMRRADFRCAETLQELHDAPRAVTRQGQVKLGDRHEKDDRARVDDPRNWVLGWANERKIDALTAQMTEQQAELLDVERAVDRLHTERQGVDRRTTMLAKLEEYSQWRDLDVAEAEARVAAAQEEKARLLAGSSRLEELDRRLRDNEAEQDRLGGELERARGRLHVLGDRIDQSERARARDAAYVDDRPAEQLGRARAAYDGLTRRLGAELPTEPDDCPSAEVELTGRLQQRIDRIGRELGGFAQSLLGYMAEIRRRWPEATTEMDVSVEALADFRVFHERVAKDDLPKFEAEFKRQLNTNTIRELAGFNSWLRRQADDIHARVARINEALGAIDFNPGRYIRLEAARTVNQSVQDFRTDLRAATDDTLGPDDDRYSERRYLEVQRIIERLRGREGHTDADKAWTRQVTDVRNWFTFSASERDKESDEEWEHYRDSDGKSGGQKEKLAYTILAASLAYQFGLEWGVERSRDFRFAVIDEAFGRGSDASTRYALDLFGRLGLQLLIVTPLQKVHVIEPYVRAIGFVDNPTGSGSRLQTLTIEEFRARRESGSAGRGAAE